MIFGAYFMVEKMNFIVFPHFSISVHTFIVIK